MGRIGIVLLILVGNGHVGNDSWTESGPSDGSTLVLGPLIDWFQQVRHIDNLSSNRDDMADWRELDFGISEEDILARIRKMVDDTEFIENSAPYADEWDHANPDLSSWKLFFDLQEYYFQELHAENEGNDGAIWLLQARWDQQRRNEPDVLPYLYSDDYVGWRGNVLQLTCDGNHSLTQREIGESDPTLLIDYLNTTKKIASVSADYLSTAKEVEDNMKHEANMQRLVSLVDSRLEALGRGMMFTDDLQTQIHGDMGRPRIFGRSERLTHIVMIVILGIILATVLLIDHYA